MSLRVFKDTVKRYAPQATSEAITAYYAAKMRRYFRREFSARQRKYKSLIYGNADPIVLSGPFAGMRYLNEIVWGPIESKWLGTYERELYPILTQILKTSYLRIFDVGSAEGYYAVGLARHFPNAIIYSYDVDPWARRQQRRLASLNGVKNVRLGRLCSSAELTTELYCRTLLISDIEGHEYELLDPIKAPALLNWDILVEVHVCKKDGFTIQNGKDELIGRFSSSHDITSLELLPRDAPLVDRSILGCLTPAELADCMDERRGTDQIWLWLEAKACT